MTEMKNSKRQDVTINVDPAVTVLYSRFIEINIDGLIEIAQNTVGLTEKGAEEFLHITRELFIKSFAIALPDKEQNQ